MRFISVLKTKVGAHNLMIKGYRTQSIVFRLLSRLFIQSIGVLRRQLLTVVNEHIKKNNKKNISNVTLHY